jgi:CheY-like chemotaxis protein
VVRVEAELLEEEIDPCEGDQAPIPTQEPNVVQLHFSVRDTGIGIPPDRMDRLFKSFSQVDSSMTRKYGGTGLGLTISKQLSEIMGGTMWVESGGTAGKGSTFHFTIVATIEDQQLFLPDDLKHISQLADKRVLIVDDNSTNRRILTLYAETWGLRPLALESPLNALEMIRQGESFDVAILDCQMPEMDGVTLAKEIRELRAARELPIIILSSHALRRSTDQTNLFAAQLTRPIKPGPLRGILVKVLTGQDVTVRRETKTCVDIDGNMGQRHPLRILLAEDNAVNQKVALRILERIGYRADLAANGLEVVEALQRQQYDVVLMDVQMPEMDGVEATHRLRQTLPADRQPRIIAMTAHALSGNREEYLEAGMDDYISKPVRIEDLMNVLEKTQPNLQRPSN